MTSLLKSKKGQIGRVLIGIVVFLVIFGFVNILSYALLSEFIAGFTTAGIFVGEAAVTGNKFLFAISIMDYVIVLLLTIFAVGIIITSFKVASSPVFFVVQFFAMFFYGFISYFLNFIFIQLVSPTAFDAARLFFQNTMIIGTNLHWIMLVNFVIASISFFAKREKGQFLS